MMREYDSSNRLTAQFTAHFGIFTRPASGAVVVLERLGKMAPKVGLEPTTDRLTADCSTIELLWNPKNAWNVRLD